jgi:transposase
MSRKSSYISDELLESAQKELKKLGKDALISRKLEAIIAACKYGISEVAGVYDVTRSTLLFWIKNFKATQLEHLKAPPSRRRKSILSNSDRDAIKNIIEENPQVTINFLVQKVSEFFGKKISKSSMHREIQKMKYSYITPRPQHYKQDKEKVDTFKKTSTRS